ALFEPLELGAHRLDVALQFGGGGLPEHRGGGGGRSDEGGYKRTNHDITPSSPDGAFKPDGWGNASVVLWAYEVQGFIEARRWCQRQQPGPFGEGGQKTAISGAV